MECRAKINPIILKWAREQLSLSIEEVVHRLGISSISTELLTLWEQGEDFPSVSFAKKLAKFYGINFIVLYSKDIPKKIKPLKDFRGVDSLHFSRNFILLMRDIQGKQEILKELLINRNNGNIPFVNSVKFSEGVLGLVKTLKEIISDQFSIKKKADKNIRNIVNLFESLGISVSFANSFNGNYLYSVPPKEVRGFAIADPVAPFIFINSKDSHTAQLFTLIHEFCHILLGETGIGDQSTTTNNEIERLCNQATAEFLIPNIEFEKVLRNNQSKSIEEKVSILTKHFPVSSLSILIKLFSTNRLSRRDFELMYKQHKESFDRIKKQVNSKGFALTHQIILRKNGKNFTNTVLDSLQSGKITFNYACVALGVSNRNKFDTYVKKWSKYL